MWPPDPLHLSNKRSLSLKISSMDEYPVIVTFSKLYDFLPSAEQKRRDLENIGNMEHGFGEHGKNTVPQFWIKVCDGEEIRTEFSYLG